LHGVANHALYAGNHVLGNAESDALMLIHVNKCAPKSVTDQSATPHVLGFDYTSWYKARVTDLGCMKSKYPNIDVHILAFQDI
jgi:hypothetical protein